MSTVNVHVCICSYTDHNSYIAPIASHTNTCLQSLLHNVSKWSQLQHHAYIVYHTIPILSPSFFTILIFPLFNSSLLFFHSVISCFSKQNEPTLRKTPSCTSIIILYIDCIAYTKHRGIFIACLYTHEIESCKRLHDHVMDESDLRRSPVERPSV